jgi:hypothetical protein
MSDCCCDVDMYDADPTTILVQRVLVGRKDHICGECGSVIPKGTEHECVQFVSDGTIETHRTCEPCLRIRRDYFRCGWIFGSMREDFKQCMGFDYCGEQEAK